MYEVKIDSPQLRTKADLSFAKSIGRLAVTLNRRALMHRLIPAFEVGASKSLFGTCDTHPQRPM